MIKLFVIDLHCHTKFWEKRGVWGSSRKKCLHFEALGLHFWRLISKANSQTNWM
jgi:hypothetical protein